MAQLDNFKAQLIGGGARANQFQVLINWPAFVSDAPPTGPGAGAAPSLVEKTSYLCRATNLPGMTLAEIAVPFRGRSIYIAGDRTFDDSWTTTFLNDTNFTIRNAVEKWQDAINDLKSGLGLKDPRDYQADLEVSQMDRGGVILKKYIFRNAWPTTISSIDLTSDTADAIEEFEVTWRYQHFESSLVTERLTNTP